MRRRERAAAVGEITRVAAFTQPSNWRKYIESCYERLAFYDPLRVVKK